VVLLEGGYASTAVSAIEVFHSAGLLWNRLQGTPLQPRFRVRTASIDGSPVSSACALGLVPQHAIHDIETSDIVILAAPGMDILEGAGRKTELLDWLRRLHGQGALVAGVCSGVAYMAESGLLDGRRATTHWALADAMRQRFPKVLWDARQFVTEDAGLLCSGGVYAGLDLSLYLVDKFCGRETALQCARSLLVSMPRTHQHGYAVLPLTRPHDDEQVRRAEEYLQAHFARPVSTEAIALRIGMSQRNLIRRFKAATGHLPGAYVQALRVTAAKQMLEGGSQPIQGVASGIGYEDVAFFRTLFKRHTGMTPAEYRRRFAPLNVGSGEASGPGGTR